MSKVLKKVFSGVKKVFKKVVKVVKKVAKSKVFKVLVAAAAIYLTAGALSGAAGGLAGGGGAAGASAGTASAAGASGAAAGASGAAAGVSGAAAGATTAGSAVGSMTINPAWLNAVAPASTTASTAATATSAMGKILAGGKAALGWAQANPLVAATGMNAVGTYMGGKAQEKQMEEDRYRREQNAGTDLNIYENTMRGLQGGDFSAMGQVASRGDSAPYATNTEAKTPHYYDTANNKWQRVSTA